MNHHWGDIVINFRISVPYSCIPAYLLFPSSILTLRPHQCRVYIASKSNSQSCWYAIFSWITLFISWKSWSSLWPDFWWNLLKSCHASVLCVYFSRVHTTSPELFGVHTYFSLIIGSVGIAVNIYIHSSNFLKQAHIFAINIHLSVVWTAFGREWL